MFTADNHDVDSRDDCIEAAAEALADCWRVIEERETTTAPAA